MADAKISDLVAVTTPVGTDLLAIAQSGVTKKMTLAQLLAMGTSPGTFSALTATTLATTGAHTQTGSAAADLGFVAKVSGDGNNRFQIGADGKMQWGSGAASPDAVVERSAASTLKLTGSLKVEGGLSVDQVGNAADALSDMATDAGENRHHRYYSGTSLRWIEGVEDTAEGGSDAGSNWELLAYDDTATLIGTALSITRSTMDAVFGAKLTSTGDFAVNGTKFTVAASTGAVATEETIEAAEGAWFRSTALALAATTGHFYVPGCSGVPTGVPATKTGQVALQYDTTNDDLYVYNGGWVKVALA